MVDKRVRHRQHSFSIGSSHNPRKSHRSFIGSFFNGPHSFLPPCPDTMSCPNAPAFPCRRINCISLPWTRAPPAGVVFLPPFLCPLGAAHLMPSMWSHDGDTLKKWSRCASVGGGGRTWHASARKSMGVPLCEFGVVCACVRSVTVSKWIHFGLGGWGFRACRCVSPF